MRRLPPETYTLYAEILQQIIALDASRSIGNLKGCFVTKKVKNKIYYYFQHYGLNGGIEQIYLGKKSGFLDELAEKYQEEKKLLEPDIDHIKKLCAQIKAGGGMSIDYSCAKVISSLADSGVFKINGVLVGTHAFITMGNMLGVNWETHIKTQDIDIAAPREIDVAIPNAKVNLPGTLEGLKMGFLPVPQLNHKHYSTSFKVMGSSLIVDILVPLDKNSEKPVLIPALNTAAQPLRFLDYLIDNYEKAVVINGNGILVNVPNPARFAFHKLMVSCERPASMHAKSEKDFAQAASLFSILTQDRHGDLLMSFEEIKRRGRSWMGKLKKGINIFKTKYDVEYRNLASIVPGITDIFK